LSNSDTLIVLDVIEFAGSEIFAEQFWHPGQILGQMSPQCFELTGNVFLCLGGPELPVASSGEEYGWRSPAPGTKEPSPLIVVTRRGEKRLLFGAALRFGGNPVSVTLESRTEGDFVRLLDGPTLVAEMFAPARP
jgi:hypothetical protein